MIRAFLALPVPDEATDRLTLVQHALRLPRPVDAEAMHVTLVFLDSQPEPVLRDLFDLLSARPLPAPTLRLTGVGAFGRLDNVHATIAPDPALDALHLRCAQAARMAGIDLPARRFVPHVTLSRPRRGGVDADMLAARLGALGPLDVPTWQADEMFLYRSTLTRDGAVYDVLAGWPLVP